MGEYISDRVGIWLLVKYLVVIFTLVAVIGLRLVFGSNFICLLESGPNNPLSCLMLFTVIPFLSVSMIGYGVYEYIAHTGYINEDRIITGEEYNLSEDRITKWKSYLNQKRHILQYYPFYYVLTLLMILSALIWTEYSFGIQYRDALWGLIFDGIGAVGIAKSFAGAFGSNKREDSRMFWGFLFIIFGFGLQAWVSIPWNNISTVLFGP